MRTIALYIHDFRPTSYTFMSMIEDYRIDRFYCLNCIFCQHFWLPKLPNFDRIEKVLSGSYQNVFGDIFSFRNIKKVSKRCFWMFRITLLKFGDYWLYKAIFRNVKKVSRLVLLNVYIYFVKIWWLHWAGKALFWVYCICCCPILVKSCSMSLLICTRCNSSLSIESSC